jgi:CheY-like chemotaxis protein
VTDVTLPVMGGRELIERLRADPATASIPIVVVSGQGEASSLPVEAIVTKPFMSTEVLSAVRNVAERTG